MTGVQTCALPISRDEAKPYVPPKANTTTIVKGLMAALNEQQQRYVKEGRRQIADEYRVEYSPEAASLIKTATIPKPSEQIPTSGTPAAPAVTENTQAASPDKQQMDVRAKNYPIRAGMQVVQAIELIVRQSDYITRQANIEFDENTNLPKPNKAQREDNQKLNAKWFVVTVKIGRAHV